jgi:peptidoglycan/LPS O-acetylase OafA/YrhL
MTTAPGSSGPARGWLLDSEHNRRVVDGLRAIGIVLVVAFHGAFLFTKVLTPAQLDGFVAGLPSVLNVVWQALGSELVFFSSGFLLCYLLLREHGRYGSIDARDFWIRRASRILPLFLLALAVFMIGRSFHWDRFLANLLMVSRVTGHFDLLPHAGKNYVPVGWSLEVMVQVYAALPLIVWFVLRTRRPLAAALVLVLLSIAPRWIALAADPVASATPYHELVHGGDAPQLLEDLYYLTWFRLTPFLIGLVAAVVATHHRAALEHWCRSTRRATATLLVGAAFVVASSSLPLHARDGWVYEAFTTWHWQVFWTMQRAVLVTGAALVLLTLLGTQRGPAGLAGRLLAWRGFAPVSSGIYSIYLFHFVCLVPAAVVVFLPAVVEGIANAPSLDRKVLVEHVSLAIDSANVGQYLAMVAIAVWLSARLATFLTRVVEQPVQDWLRTRYRRRERVLLPVPRLGRAGAGDSSAADPDRDAPQRGDAATSSPHALKRPTPPERAGARPPSNA